MNLPNDPLEALKWVMHHWDSTWWIIGALGVGVAWTRKRLSDWSRRNALPLGGAPAAKPAAAQPVRAAVASPAPAYAAAPSYAAAGYTSQPAYAAAAPAPAQHAPASSRKLYREADAPQRTAGPVARSVNVPGAAAAPAAARWTLAGAFGDAAHARNAIIVAEVLGPPVGLR